MRLTSMFVAIAAFFTGIACLTAHAQQKVPNSYIVTFKPTTSTKVSPIEPLQVPGSASVFGEPKSGQSKSALARTIGIRGSVVNIFETINAAQVKIDESDLQLLRRDARVLRVEPN